MTDLTRKKLDALRDAAEKATMGPWSYHGPDCCEDDDSDCDATGPEAQVMYYGDSSGQCIAETWANADAHFIAAANPQTILALLDALRATEQRAEQAERDAARAAVVVQLMDNLIDVTHLIAAEDNPWVARPDQEIIAGLRDGYAQGRNHALSVMQGTICRIRHEAMKRIAPAPVPGDAAQGETHNNTAAKETPCDHQEPDAQ